jgi:MFS superfamily sulfate permease-like transporter
VEVKMTKNLRNKFTQRVWIKWYGGIIFNPTLNSSHRRGNSMVQMHIMTSLVYVLQPLSNPLFSRVFQSSSFVAIIILLFLVVKIGLEEHTKMMEDRILHTLWWGRWPHAFPNNSHHPNTQLTPSLIAIILVAY